MKPYIATFVIVIIVLSLCLQCYEGFDPNNAGYSAPAAKEYADTFGFDRLRDASKRDVKNPTQYYVPPVSVTLYFFLLAFLLCMVLLQNIYNLDSNLMMYLYFTILSGGTIHFIYSNYANLKNGMYVG